MPEWEGTRSDLWTSRITWLLISFVLSFKCLLIRTYRSTDFEVHRNWLAITHHLPLGEWYYSELNADATLDYPPLFAYMEKGLALLANLYDPDILRLQSEAHYSEKVLLFQRTSVILLDAVYIFASMHLSEVLVNKVRLAGKHKLRSRMKLCLFSLLLFQPGLILLDNIHFQYNSFLFGLLVLTISFIVDGRMVVGALIFSVLLNFKHINLYYVPGMVAFYLCHYLRPIRGLYAIRLFGLLLVAATLPLIIAFGPFYLAGEVAGIRQIISRLFPFKRGLTHSYWVVSYQAAPNAWALYNFADFILYKLLTLIRANCNKNSTAPNFSCSLRVPLYTRGIVGEDGHSVLPDITPSTTFLLVLLSICTIPLAMRRGRGRSDRVESLLTSLILSSYGFFLFSWHVHEKATMMMLIPMTLLIFKDLRFLPVFVELLLSSSFSLLPLFFTPMEQGVKYAILGAYFALVVVLFRYTYGLRCSQLTITTTTCYASLLTALEVYKTFIHGWLFPNAKFLPLMATSVLCATGVVWSYFHFLIIVLGENWLLEWRKWWCRRREATVNAASNGREMSMEELPQRVGGVDISTAPSPFDQLLGVISYTLIDYSRGKAELVDSLDEVVLLHYPYIPGYLAMREAGPVANLVKRAKSNGLDLLLVDGNGTFHPRGCGLASHVGHLTCTKSVGIAKKLDGGALAGILGVEGEMAEILKQELTRRCEQLDVDSMLECRFNNEKLRGRKEKTLFFANRKGRPYYISAGYDMNERTLRGVFTSKELLKDGTSPVKLSDQRSRAIADELFNR